MEDGESVPTNIRTDYRSIASVCERFLSAKFGDDMVLSYDGYVEGQYEGRRIGGLLHELLEEFGQIVNAGDLVELQNPRTKQFTLIDKSKGIIIGSYDKSFLEDVEVASK